MNKRIKFSQNWNKKLDCDLFTTLRPKNKGREVGDLFYVELKGHIIKTAQLIKKKTFILKDLPEFTAALDTGYSKPDTLKLLQTMYKHKYKNVLEEEFDLMLFKTILLK